MKCKLKETDLCSFCNETKESILHLFWDCMVVKNLWLEIDSFIQNTCNIYLPLSAKSIILGVDPSGTHLTSLLIVLVKYYIYSCRFRSMTPCFIGAKTFIKQSYLTEKLSVLFYKTHAGAEKIRKKWEPLSDVLKD